MDKQELVSFVIGNLPYGNQIDQLDFTTEEKAIRFRWRKEKRFRVTTDLFVDEIGDGVLIGSDISILMQHILIKARQQ
jgi:hypothetical protein